MPSQKFSSIFSKALATNTNDAKDTAAPNNIHLSRRIQHAATGLVLLLISYIIPPYPVGCLLLSLATSAFYFVHTKRIDDEEWDMLYLEQFGELLRRHEIGEWEEMKETTTSEVGNARGSHLGSKDGTEKKKSNHNSPGNASKSSAKNGISPTSTIKRKRKTNPSLPGAFYFLLGTTLSTMLFSTTIARTALLVLSLADPMAGLVGSWFSGIASKCGPLRWLGRPWSHLFQNLVHVIKGNIAYKSGGRIVGGPTIMGSIACALTTISCTYVYFPIAVRTQTIGNASVLTVNSRICIGIITAMVEAVAGRDILNAVTMVLRGTVGGKDTENKRKLVVLDDNLLIPLIVGLSIRYFTNDGVKM